MMIRNYKVFGLALVAMLALSAFMAQGASAVPLTCEDIPVGGSCYSTGDQDGGTHVFKSAGGSVSCVEATFKGTPSATGSSVNEQTVEANYPTEKSGGGNNCTAFGFAGAHVKMNGCTYTFTTPTQVAGQPTGVVTYMNASETEPLHLTCPTGKAVEITPTFLGSSVCTQTIAAQTPTGGHVTGKNAGGPLTGEMDVTLEITLTGIHYTGTGSSCGDATTHSDGTLTGNSTVQCYSNATHTTKVGCTFS
jgi:hypothetical protein